MIILDTSGIIAAYNKREQYHETAREVLLQAEGPFVVSPMVLAEVDYLATKYLGASPTLQILAELEALARVAVIANEDIGHAVALLRDYVDLAPGLTDAINVLVAGRYNTTVILTLDQHYRVIRPLRGEAFRLLPRDRQ